MKRMIVFLLFCGFILLMHAAGVVVNRGQSVFQTVALQECNYEVGINNQIAEVTVKEVFINYNSQTVMPRLYFPMPRGANATNLKWFSGGAWHEASISGVPQTHPGGPSTFPDNFVLYMQLMPLIFDIPDSLAYGDSLKYELTYVQLLNNNYGSVTINLKNDYSYIQLTSLAKQSLSVDVVSEKQIVDFDILNVPAQTTHSAYTATGSYLVYNQPATQNYRCVVMLSNAELSSWGISTIMQDPPDNGNHGFFIYSFAEDSLPADTVFAINLNIVIDVSGSMSFEDRLVNAKAAACYVISHLQPNDRFNVILYDHLVRPRWNQLQPVTPTNQNSAIDYVNNYEMPSLNGTNLYGALSTAISQFGVPAEGYKNCVLLLSDGLPTVGVTDTYQIIHNINSQVANAYTEPHIFCFGVGSEVNYQLLNSLAQYHKGISIFLESAEIVNTITSFYNELRNPIFPLANLSISPASSVSEIFPDPFPSIYGGMEYRIVGRYSFPHNLQLNLSGLHYGYNHSYNYEYQLQNVGDSTLSFIPKVWASAKIDKLLIEYYNYPPNSSVALSLRQQIIDLSIGYGVVCVFTSFSPPDDTEDEIVTIPQVAIKLLPNVPNPFNPSTMLRFEVMDDLKEEAEIRIYNLKGQLIYTVLVPVYGKGVYQVEWNGKDLHDRPVSSGVYIYTIRCGKYILHNKMTLQK
jgi:Ca-activated chloride channel family protein